MTGNKNAWRAPLAGLASVAMIATMGVAASTANAAELTHALSSNVPPSELKVAVFKSDEPTTPVQSVNGKPATNNFHYGDVFQVPASGSLQDPYRGLDHKVLTGFSYDREGKNPAKDNIAVKGDTKLYAQYTEGVQVTFKGAKAGAAGVANGGTSDTTIEIAKGSGVTAADYAGVLEPTANPGYVFAGWKLTASKDAQDLYVGGALDKDTTLYPVFVKYSEKANNASVVKFGYVNNLSKDMVMYTLDDQSFPAFRAPADATWLNAGAAYDFTAPVDADENGSFNKPDLTLTQQTKATNNEVTVVYNFNGAQSTVQKDNSIDLDATFDHGQFTAVNYAKDQAPAQPNTPAKWKNAFTTWYDENGNTVDFSKPVSTLPDKNHDNLTMIKAGWDKTNVSGVQYVYGYNAQQGGNRWWSTFNNTKVQGRDLKGVAFDFVTTGSAIQQPTGVEDYFQTPEDLDHGTYSARKVVSWQSAIDDSPISVLTAGDFIVYAKWAEAESAFLNANGGNFANGNSVAWVTKTDGQKWSDVLVNRPVREGYNFAGWYNNVDGEWRFNANDGHFYDALGNDKGAFVNGNTLYAIWTLASEDAIHEQMFKYNVTFIDKAYDTATLTKLGYTTDSAKAYVDAIWALRDEYQTYLGLSGQARVEAAAKLSAKITAAEALLERAGNPVDPPFSSPFVDVTVDTPHATDINKLFEMGVTKGWTEANGTLTFRPATEMNRQDYAAFLYRLAGSPEFDAAKAKNPFADVNESTPHFKEILWAASNGVIKGYEKDGKTFFEGMASIQRQDALVMLYRLAGEPKVADDAANFADASKTPFKAALAWAKATGVSEGYPDGSFGVGLNIIRQDMAAFLVRAANVINK